jgi:hypothetical protein
MPDVDGRTDFLKACTLQEMYHVSVVHVTAYILGLRQLSFYALRGTGNYAIEFLIKSK